jgi:hypothetical protein
MKCCFVRKVPYRLSRNRNRIVWSMVLSEREGVALLYVPKPDEDRSHMLVIATENVQERIFEDVGANHFQLATEDLTGIGVKLQALAESVSEAELKKFFEREDLF